MTSSSITPRPPGTRRSMLATGQGLRISKSLNRANPSTTPCQLRGVAVMVMSSADDFVPDNTRMIRHTEGSAGPVAHPHADDGERHDQQQVGQERQARHGEKNEHAHQAAGGAGGNR